MPPAKDNFLGQKLGPFTIEKRIGAGAMGAVYRAKFDKGGFVAIKVMLANVGTSDSTGARFDREASILKQLKHPNIVRLIATGRYQNQPFFAMEYLQGEGLDQVLERRDAITWEQVVTLGEQLCAALQHAHEKGIIHRDLKPSNVMVLTDGTAKLTDFGIAKDLDVTALTSAHCTVGTAAYMSPEQCRGEATLTNKSDLYSLGVMLYELLTGEKPFKAQTAMEMFLQHCNGTFLRPSRVIERKKLGNVPRELDVLVAQLLEKKPEDRPRDAELVGQVLAKIKANFENMTSAAVSLIKSRKADRPREVLETDLADKLAVTSLKEALGKKKKKKKEEVKEKKWPKALLYASLLIASLGLIYWAAQPPGQSTLYTRVKQAVESNDDDQMWYARYDPQGALKLYLQRFGKEESEMSRQVRRWADEYDANYREKQLKNRTTKKFELEDEHERLAVQADEAEKEDKFEEASNKWKELLEQKASANEDKRSWGLLAQKRLSEYKQAKELEESLRKQVREAHLNSQSNIPNEESERLAHRALRHEIYFNDYVTAFDRWSELKNRTEQSPNQRVWLILAKSARRKIAAQTDWVADLEPRKTNRKALLENKMRSELPNIEEKVDRATWLAQQFLDLYEKDTELKVLVEEVKAKLK